jgi:hypothetical protein
MNAVEIEEAVSALAEQHFDAEEFPFAFLEAFGNKETTLKRLRSGTYNKSDLGGVLQTGNIHIKSCSAGEVSSTLDTLRTSPATTKGKVQFIVATDGTDFQAEDLSTGETVACDYGKFSDHFGFFLPLAGISTVKEIRENAFDIKATSRLNKLYIELLKDNPEWGTAARRQDLNHFMARLIFCFFAEDTDIFNGVGLFTTTVDKMSARDSSNTHEVISEIFRAMNTKLEERTKAGIKSWANAFPYVNGGLYAGSTDTPVFSKIARSYLMHVGNLDWTKINPDIFGSMIQAVADDEERGALGMHYTSVPNILKVLNPLFLDDLREKLAEAGDNARKLLNLRNRIARIRVCDPACGSGNFLVIAYKEMRVIEAEINARRNERNLRSVIPVRNFRGIELRDFSVEIARLALIIAEYQCDVLYLGQKEALAVFLPLDTKNWITCGNALRLDWLSIWDPSGKKVKIIGDDLFSTPLDQSEIDFENEAGETYICGNPPYLGSVLQDPDQKLDLKGVFESRTNAWKSLDYVAAWFMKAADYSIHTATKSAFVSTNSICQGEQVPILWPLIFQTGNEIDFAYTSFKWANLASNKAGVTVVIVGLSQLAQKDRKLFTTTSEGTIDLRVTPNINPYLVAAPNAIVKSTSRPISPISRMLRGNLPNDGGYLLLSETEKKDLEYEHDDASRFIRKFIGSREFINSIPRFCLWIEDEQLNDAYSIPAIRSRIEAVRKKRQTAGKQARDHAGSPHKFVFAPHLEGTAIAIPAITSENRDYLPVGIVKGDTIVGAKCYVMYGVPIWNLALIASRVHWIWISAISARLEMRFSYANTLGWNTFPLPPLTETNKSDLTKCAEDILLAREEHFPATIADLYDPKKMPANLKAAHDRNDEVLERIFIGRRFKNDTERLEKLFELYTKMTATTPMKKGAKR